MMINNNIGCGPHVAEDNFVLVCGFCKSQQVEQFTMAQLLDVWDAANHLPSYMGSLYYTTCELLLDELKRRDPDAFDRWNVNEDDAYPDKASPRAWFTV